MRAPVCDGDGSAACARVGGLVLRARPQPETLSRASSCPSAWTACGFGAQAFAFATAFNANIASWNVLSVTNYNSAFGIAGLVDCIKRGVYDNWGSTLQRAYPTWSSLSVCATAITNTNIGTAVTAWLTDPRTATTTYGPIADWNTAAVTSMANLFYQLSTARPTFNADISKWNVASVSTMYSVCAPCLRLDGIFI